MGTVGEYRGNFKTNAVREYDRYMNHDKIMALQSLATIETYIHDSGNECCEVCVVDVAADLNILCNTIHKLPEEGEWEEYKRLRAKFGGK